MAGAWGLLCLDCVTWIVEQQQETRPHRGPRENEAGLPGIQVQAGAGRSWTVILNHLC